MPNFPSLDDIMPLKPAAVPSLDDVMPVENARATIAKVAGPTAGEVVATAPTYRDPPKAKPAAPTSLVDDVKYTARQAAGALGASIFDLTEGVYGIGRAAVENLQASPLTDMIHAKGGRTLLDPVADWLKDRAGDMKATGALVAGETPEGFIAQSLKDGLRSVPQSAAALGFAVMGAPSIGLTMLSGGVAGQAYNQAREQGVDPRTSASFAAAQGVIEYATEHLPIAKYLEDTKVGSSFGKKLIHNIASEMVGEQAATALQDFNEFAVLHPEKSLGDYMRERPAAIASTAIAVMVGSSVTMSGEHIAGKLAERGQRMRAGAAAAPGSIDTAVAEASQLTPEDIDSPIPNDVIATGKAALARATARSGADEALNAAGIPATGKRVQVDMGNGKTGTGTVSDIFTHNDEELGAQQGVRVALDDGTSFEEFLSTIQRGNMSVNEINPEIDLGQIVPAPEAQSEDAPLPTAQRQGAAPALPVQGGRITSGFGQREAPIAGASTNHQGIDIAAPRGTPVAAMGPGKVLFARGDGPNGNIVRIQHEDGSVSSYAHLDSIGVEAGDEVAAGQQIGQVGSTGRSTGPHLHYAVKKDGKFVDPSSVQFSSPQAEGAAEGAAVVSSPEPEQVTAVDAPPVTPIATDSEPVVSDEPTAQAAGLQDIAGDRVDGEWRAFSDASGTLGVPRALMPQIKAEHRGAMTNFLKARGIDAAEETVAADSLKPSQAEFSEKKVEKALGFEGGNRAILVSQDGHVVDGHHQWMAARQKGENIRVIRLNAPIQKILETVSEFPSATTDGATSSPSAAAHPANAEPLFDKTDKQIGWFDAATGATFPLDAPTAQEQTPPSTSADGGSEGSTATERPAAEPAIGATSVNAGPAVADGSENTASGVAPQNNAQPPKAKRVRKDAGPVDALTFIARAGGLRDDEGHNLRKRGREMGQYAPGGGHIFRKNGMSIDRAGELLHEGGYFPGDRPTEAEVLDLLRRAETERVYRPEDTAEMRERDASSRRPDGEDEEAVARAAIKAVSVEYGEPLASREIAHMLALMADGATAHEAFVEHFEMEAADVLSEAFEATRDETYDVPDDQQGDPGYDPAFNPASDTEGKGGQAPTEAVAGARGARGADAEQGEGPTEAVEDSQLSGGFAIEPVEGGGFHATHEGKILNELGKIAKKAKPAKTRLGALARIGRSRIEPSATEAEAPAVNLDDLSSVGIEKETFFRGVTPGKGRFSVANGPLGRGVYLSAQRGVAEMYNSQDVAQAKVAGRILRAIGSAGKIEPIERVVLPHMNPAERAQYDRKRGQSARYVSDFIDILSRSAEPDRMSVILKSAGFDGVEGIVDGHEIVVFDARDVSEIGAEPLAATMPEPEQPKRTMTQAQRGELEARQQQQMARRGGQEAVSDQAGGMFSSERDQGDLLSEPKAGFSSAMTREQFLGSPRITPNANASDLKPKALAGLENAPAETFAVDGLTARYDDSGAAVYDGDRVVASYNFGDTLVVDRKYRRKGIAEELVYQWRKRHPGPAVARERTKASQAIQEKVWARIERERVTPSATPSKSDALFSRTAPTTKAFRDWFGDSKVVDADGQPMVVYHGTESDFTTFDPDLTGKTSDYGWFGKGSYFTPDAEQASRYATVIREGARYGDDTAKGQVIPVYLSAENPFITEQNSFNQEYVNRLRDDGYDAIFRYDRLSDDLPEEIVVFDPNQIKSAVGNNGAFDPADPRIAFSRASEPGAATDADWMALRERLSGETDKLGLGDKVVVDVLHKIMGDPNIAGMYDRGIITIAMEAGQSPDFTMNHEAIHAMRDLGLFRSAEWTALEKAAQADPSLMASVRERYADQGLDEETMVEEAVSDMFARWRQDRQGKGFIRAAFQRVMDLFAAVRQLVTRTGTADDVMRAIERGAIGARQTNAGDDLVGPSDGMSDEPKYSISGVSGIFTRSAAEPNPVEADEARERSVSLVDGFRGAPEPSRFDAARDKWRTALQDKMLPLLRVQTAIERTLGRPLSEAENPYLGEELSSGKIGGQLDRLADDMVTPLFDAMREAKVSVDELESYLYARHAPERNARIASINPEFSDDLLGARGAGSGMSNAEAAEILAAVDADSRSDAIKALAARVDDILKFSVETRIDGGLLSREEADVWGRQFENYVPLRGNAELDPETNADRPMKGGSGVTVRGKESRRAFGRKSKASDILAYSIMQAEEAITRAETNRVAQEFHALAVAAPDPNFWQVNKVTRKAVWNDAKGQVEYRAENRIAAEDAPYTVSLKIDGAEHRVTLNRDNPTAVRVADAMRNLTGQQMQGWVKVIGSATRLFSRLNTTWNPEFLITNAFRDIQGASVNLAQYNVKGLISGTVRDWKSALLAPAKGDSEWAQWRKEFELSGGKVYFNDIGDLRSIRERITREMDKANGLSIKSGMRSFLGFVDQMNDRVENAVRLAAFKNARQAGMSTSQAASVARNATVNFTRKGQFGPVVNSLYAFFNAGVQGSATLVLAANRSKKVRGALAGMVLLGFLLDALNRWSGDDDDDGQSYWSKVPAYDKEKNLIVMVPGWKDKTVKVPLALGLNAFVSLGRNISEMVHGRSIGEAAGEAVTTSIDAFNPIGGGGTLLNAILPTFLDPIADLTTNKNFAGKPIQPEPSPYDTPEPPSERYFPNVSTPSKLLTKWVNEVTGGDSVVPGKVSVSPEVVDYVAAYFAGGAGRFLMNTGGLLLAPADPDRELTVADFPFARKMVGTKPQWLDKGLYYDRVREITDTLDHAQSYAKAGDADKLNGYVDDNRRLLALEPLAKASKKQMSAIRKQRLAIDDAVEKGRMSASDGRSMKAELEKSSGQIVAAFNGRWNASLAASGIDPDN